MAKGIVAMQPAAHGAVPGGYVGWVEIGIYIINLVEELPGEEVRAISISRDEISQPFLVNRLGEGVGEEGVLVHTRPTVHHVIGIVGPIIVAAPIVRDDLEHTVVI